MKIKEYFIKKLGGFTSKDMTRATSKAQKSAVKNYKRSKPTLRGKRITPGWLKSEVHRSLGFSLDY